MQVTVRLTNHRVPPYILTGVAESAAAELVQEWQWGTARVIPFQVDGRTVYLARREILSAEVHPED